MLHTTVPSTNCSVGLTFIVQVWNGKQPHKAKMWPVCLCSVARGCLLPPTPQISTIFSHPSPPTFCFSLTFTLFWYWCWAPFNSTSTHGRAVSRYFLPPRFETQFGVVFFSFFGGVGGRCWGSQAAPMKNETFTIPLGCKSEFLVLKLGGRIPFMR